MGEIDTTLKIIAAVLGIMAIIFPVVAAAVLWKASQTFATRDSLRAAVKRVERQFDTKVQQVERDIERGHKELLAAIEQSRNAMRADINGIGERLTEIKETAAIAKARADTAQHDGEMLAQRVTSIDEHGTKKTARLEEQIQALTNNLSLFNKLIEQGMLRASPPEHHRKEK